MSIQALLSLVRQGRATVAFFAPEPSPAVKFKPEDATIFQYWPEMLNDEQTPNYSPKEVPGGSHPIMQWTGGGARTIGFEAVFTRELRDDTLARSVRSPSVRYTVDLAAVRSRLEHFKQPLYRKDSQTGIVEAPPRLLLFFPRMQLGGDVDELLCYMTDASVTYEKCFDDGTPRIMVVNLSFQESIQSTRGGVSGKGSAIKFKGRQRWKANQKLYHYADGDASLTI